MGKPRKKAVKLSPIGKMLKNHLGLCHSHLGSGDGHCSCGKQEATAQMAEAKSVLGEEMFYKIFGRVFADEENKEKENE